MAKTATAPTKDTPRVRDTELTRSTILRVAMEEFAEKGLSGARIDEIAERTNSSKRMIYYYFGSKEGLYQAVLDQAYTGIRNTEATDELKSLTPREALAEHVGLTFDYHCAHPEFVRLVMNENIHHGDYVSGIESIRTRNRVLLSFLAELLGRGVESGVFRKGLDALHLHMSISALCFHYVGNQYTFSQIFNCDMASPKSRAERRQIIIDTVLRWCLA
ncbi:MAG: TetR family transcriptional regulator [Gammaproteobacteria bacterium]|nr:TetR family transcriptional regulator [Gammaproteobacteria bacterium]